METRATTGPVALVPCQYSDDLSLAKAVEAGSRAAQRDLVARLLDRVRTTVRYISADDRDQDDWVQLALMEILRSAGAFKAESSLETWADRITIRTTMRHLKRRRWREQVVMLDPEVRPKDDNEPLDEAGVIQMRRRLARCLGALSPDRRTTVLLRLVHGYSLEEIAEMTDTPVNTVRDRLQVGRKKLRDKIVRDPVLKYWAFERKMGQ